MKIKIAGYPAEKAGYLYQGEGEIVRVVKTKLGGWLLFHNAATTYCNSGDSVMILDEEFIES